MHNALKEISGVLALLLPATLNVFLVHFVQSVTTQFHKDLNDPTSTWQRDPQESEILELVKKNEALAKTYSERTHWDQQPYCIHIVSVIGTLLSSLATYVLLCGKPIRPFGLE